MMVVWRLLLLVSLCLPLVARASLPTQLDSEAVVLGEAVELRIDAGTLGEPLDTQALQRDFNVRSHRQQRISELRGGRFESRVQHVLVLEPRRAGNVVIPALAVGNARSQPMRLVVSGAASAPAFPSPANGDTRWIVQAQAGATTGWVGQPMGLQVVVLLGQDIAGAALVQEPPEGASLQNVGKDEVSRVLANGQFYQRVVRRYLLTPGKDGELVVPSARLIGRELGGLWSGSAAQVQVDGPSLTFTIRPIPADAGADWLPLHGLRLGWTVLPDQLMAGQGARFELEAVLDGATAAQRDVLVLPTAGPGWRLYPEPVQMEERFEGARPVVHLHRSFQLVPEQAGTIEIPEIAVAWWDAESGERRVARLPARRHAVLPGNGQPSATGATAGTLPIVAGQQASNAAQGPSTALRIGGALLLLLLAGALWWWRRRCRVASTRAAAVEPDGVVQGAESVLDRALRDGSVQAITDALCALRGLTDPADLPGALADDAQREALRLAERAWWVPGGDRVAARARLRRAFAEGPHWVSRPEAMKIDPLPPLYPPSRP